MAVIAQADPYNSLIRKIGYSVGLEELVERVKKVVALYLQSGSLSATEFRKLVEDEFKRRNAVDHFANFYSALNLVRTTARDNEVEGASASKVKRVSIPKALEPLYQLDSLSILRRLFLTDDKKYESALRVVLLQALIEADGDILLNALASDFQQEDLKMRLESMIRQKRLSLDVVFKTPGLRSKVYKIIEIKNESSRDQEGIRESIPVGRFGRRTEPLETSRRKSSLRPDGYSEVMIPTDYLKKVSNSRRGWAEDLGLFDDHVKTEQGQRLLSELSNCTVWTDDDPKAILFWGYKSDLERLRIKPTEVGAPSCEAWDLLSSIAASHTAFGAETTATAPTSDELVDFLRMAFALYKEGNSKGLVRNSLPLYVAEPVVAAWCVAEGRPLPAMGDILQHEYTQKVRRIQKMIIRGTIGALFFMS